MQQFVTKVLLAVSDTSEDHSFTEKSLAQVFEQGHLYQVIRVTTILLSTTLHCLTGAVNIAEGLVPCLTALNKLFLKYAKNDSSDKVTRGMKRLVILLKQILLQFDHNSDVVSGAIKALVTLANSGYGAAGHVTRQLTFPHLDPHRPRSSKKIPSSPCCSSSATLRSKSTTSAS